MDESEDLRKIDEIIKKHKVEAEDPDELEYAEFIDYTDLNEADDTIEIEDYEIPDFPKSDITQFHTYTPTHFLTDDEKRVVDSCLDPELKQLLLLNRNKNIQLMQLYKKVKDMLAECQENISMKEDFVSAARNSRRVCNRIWRLGIPYFKTKDDFPCPRNEDIARKHQNGELLFYEMTPSNKWGEKDMNRLLKGIAFRYRIAREKELEKRIRKLEKEIAEDISDLEKEELVQELKNELEDVKNAGADSYPPLGCDIHLDWNRIAELFLRDRYSAQDCQVFWNTYLHPDINKGPWTQEENEKLKALAADYNFQNWDLIAAELGNNRTGFITCVHYFCKIDPPRQGRFTAAEDKLLCELVQQYKQGEYIPWTKIAHHFKERTRGQLFYRYKYFLSCRSGKVKGKFTEAEDILILVLVDRFGKKFTKCGQYFPNRSVVQIKARYSSNLRGAIKKGSFTIGEDHEILEYVKKNGTSSWEPLVQRLNRCGGQIRQRHKTLTSFIKAHPGMELEKAPRRRFSGIAYDTEHEFLRCMADKFKNCGTIPTLQDIEKLLVRNPKPKADPLEPLKNKPAQCEPRTRGQKEQKEKTAEDLVENEEKPAENKKKPIEKKEKHKTEKVLPKERKSRPRKALKSPPPLLVPDDDSDFDETFPDMSLSVDHLLVDFFSNSLKLNFEQSVSHAHIQRAATAVSLALSTLQAELYIPDDFERDPRLDAIDLDILKILIVDRPISPENKYIISRNSCHVDRLIPPNLNTVVGMRSLLIKNQIYKSKHAKRAYIFENFKTECKEKQVLWCINNHLSNLSQSIQNNLKTERNLFFRRFVALFKFPAIMTLQKPSESLESASKAWKNEFTTGVRTYKKRPRPTPTQENKGNTAFEGVFIKQQPPNQEDENNAHTSQRGDLGGGGDNCRKYELKSSNSEPTTTEAPKLSIVEKLKRRINDAIDELNHSPPAKKCYPDSSRIISTTEFSSKTVPAGNRGSGTVNRIQQRKTYMPKSKAKTEPSKNRAAVSGENTIFIKTENLQDVYPGETEAHSSFNPSKGELVVGNDSPCDSRNASSSICQDLQDLKVLDVVLKKEKNVVEEPFDF